MASRSRLQGEVQCLDREDEGPGHDRNGSVSRINDTPPFVFERVTAWLWDWACPQRNGNI